MTGRTCGSSRRRGRRLAYARHLGEHGLTVLSLNVAGVSAFKLFMLLEKVRADVLCLQETWLSRGADILPVPGYHWYEQRRSGRRGGIAILVREGLCVHRVVGNEYAQFVELRLPNGALCTIGNTYLPPTTNLGRRRLTEAGVRESCEDILHKIHAESQLLLCGDFNARTG